MNKRGKIILTGGGSGGHITPIQAVAHELKQHFPEYELIYIGQTGDKLGDIPAEDPSIDKSYTVRAGKFRRYNGEGYKQLLDLPTMIKNARDAVFVLIGIWQSRKLLRSLQPKAVFIKGGFVGVPVGLAAASLHIPFVTHDSDAIPGLANRIISRWASMHAVALPPEVYSYPKDKTVTTGIPIQKEFQKVTAELKKKYREEIDIPDSAKLLFIIGGGLGSKRVNDAVADILPHLLHEHPDLYVVHVVGRSHETAMISWYNGKLTQGEQGRVHTFGYIGDVYRYSGAADIVITRAGATNLAEFAVQGKACIVVPNPVLTGGHQLKNAQYLLNRKAIVMLPEVELVDDPNRLAKLITQLLKDPEKRRELSAALSSFGRSDATRELAECIVSVIDQDTHEA